MKPLLSLFLFLNTLGRDISPLLFGKTTDSPRVVHYYFSGYGLQAVRQGPWKLAIAPQIETMGKPALPDASTKTPRLYNLDAEIGGASPTARRPAGKVENSSMLYSAGRAKKNKATAK